MKKTFSLLIIALIVVSNVFSQDKAKAKSETSVVWLGVDFTAAKLTLLVEDPATMVNNYYASINNLILAEPAKFDIKKFFNKQDVTSYLDEVKEKNSKINPSEITSDNAYTLDASEIEKIVKGYDLKDKSGTALVFIAENLNKPAAIGSFYVVFFDIATRNIIDSRRFEGKAVGIGPRNFWAGSIYNIMKVWLKA